MHAPLLCAVFAISIHSKLVVDQCTGCEVTQKNIIKIMRYKLPNYEDCNKQLSPLWFNTSKLDLKKITGKIIDFGQRAWNTGFKLRLSTRKNASNDTMGNTHLRDVDRKTNIHEGELIFI